MTIEELYSVQRDMNELKSLHKELSNHELNYNPHKSNAISDMPKGKGERQTYQEWYVQEKLRIEECIEYCKRKIQKDREKLNEYINNAPFPECDIIRYRVINNMDWEEIGEMIGYDRRTVSRRFYKYINKPQKVKRRKVNKVAHNAHQDVL